MSKQLPTPAVPYVSSLRRETLSRKASDASERLRQSPNDSAALFELAEAYARMERHSEAARAHRALLRADGRYADLLADANEEPAAGFIGGFDCTDCPVCGESDGELAWVGNISSQVRTWGHLDPVRQWIRCSSCETLYVEAPPSAAALDRWSAASDGPLQATAPDLNAFSAQLDQVQSELDTIERLGFGTAWVDQAEAPIPRLLEVGCDWGSFLAAAEWRGFRPTGVTAPHQADWISTTLAMPCMDIDTRSGLVPEDLPTGEFDIVILRDGIDRASDPVAVLETASNRMAPDGLMVLQLALHDHPIHRLQGYDATHWSSPDRRTFFTRQTLELTLARAGLRTEEVRHPEGAAAGVALVFVRRDDMHDLFRTE